MGTECSIFSGKNFVMRRKRVLVTCPRFTESEEVQLSYVGEGGGACGYLVFGFILSVIGTNSS